MKRFVQSRKLLVASIGVATVLYACEKKDPYPPGNLMAPEPHAMDASAPPTSGNLMPPPTDTVVVPTAADASALEMAPPGNLMPPPPPPDAGPIPKKPPHHPPGNLMPPPPHPKPAKP